MKFHTASDECAKLGNEVMSCHENFSLVKILVQGTKLSRTKILVTVQVGGPGIIYHVGDLEGREKVDAHDMIT